MQHISCNIRIHCYKDTVELAEIEQGASSLEVIGSGIQFRKGGWMAWLI